MKGELNDKMTAWSFLSYFILCFMTFYETKKMKGKTSSSKSKNGGLEIEKLEKLEETPLSGAYIRSLVKHLTSSRTKDSSDPKDHDNLEGGEGIPSNRCLAGDRFSDTKHEESHQPQQHKKQVRRRLHTCRPHQERLLNMAEARREIVTALKFHRAAMKRASEQQQRLLTESGPETQPFEPSSNQLYVENEAKLESTSHNFPTNCLVDTFSYSPGFYSPYSSWSVPPISPLPALLHENFNSFALPDQTLGLSLNLQDLNNFNLSLQDQNTPFDQSSSKPSAIHSSSSPSTSSSPLSSTTEEAPCMGRVAPPAIVAEVAGVEDNSGLHPAMDDEEMAEIRSIGELYEMELNDTLNLVNSAWWFKFLKAMEFGQDNDSVNCSPFDEVMELVPDWLNTNEIFLPQHVNDLCSDYNFQDLALPCMDMEEMEGMDGDWLA